MIINGGSRSGGAFFARHLMRGDENERVSVVEIRGLAAENVRDAFSEMEAVASGTRINNYFYHSNMNTRAEEHLTSEQWEQATDTLERELGLTGQPRFVVEHVKEGRTHRHVVWSRIAADEDMNLKAISDAHNYRRHELAAREIEQEFGLEPVESVLVKDRGTERPERRPKDWESFRGQDSQIDPHVMKAEITALWQEADSGQSFKAALEQAGYILAKGDRRDFVVVDQAGDDHSLARRISGAKAADIRARMADVDRTALPSVAEARELATTNDASTSDPLPAGDTPHIERPGERQPQGEPELAGSCIPDDAIPLPAARAEDGGVPIRVSPWGAAWRVFSDRAMAFADQLYAFIKDETSGTPEGERGLAARVFDAGKHIVEGWHRHNGDTFAKGILEATALLRDQPHAPPEGESGDLARPGGKVEPPEPDTAPQAEQAAPVGSPSDFDAFAEQWLRETWDAEPEPDEPGTPEEEPDAPGYDGPDID